MAAKTLYLKSAKDAQGWASMSETAQAAATTGHGWTVSTGATNHSALQAGVERAAITFLTTLDPDGFLDNVINFDAFRSENAYTGDFANANWEFHGVVRAVTNGGAQDGRVRFRLFKADADGTNATEIGSGQRQCAAVANVSTSADFDSNLTFNPGAFSISNQYIFLEIAWERTGAGGMTSADILFRTGSSSSAGTRVVTADLAVTVNYTATVSGGVQTGGAGTTSHESAQVASGGTGPGAGLVRRYRTRRGRQVLDHVASGGVRLGGQADVLVQLAPVLAEAVEFEIDVAELMRRIRVSLDTDRTRRLRAKRADAELLGLAA